MTRHPIDRTWIAVAAVALLLVLACTVGILAHRSNTRACHAQHGTVVVDHDTKRVYDKKTGKWKTKTDTEHECIVNGREVNEW